MPFLHRMSLAMACFSAYILSNMKKTKKNIREVKKDT